ncbi:MAG: DUF2723 domain-containing protein, partial [Vicinamibacterales bacterium]
LATLPAAPDDIDALNFMLGVRDFDVARHQPHPPGYPVFIALGKLSTPVLRAAGVPAPEVRGLALWSAVAGSALVLLGLALWRAIDADPWRPVIATLLTIAAPLFWFTSLRPLSDVTGLCLAVASLVLVLRALPPPWTTAARPSARALVAGAFLAGLAIGIRSQTVLLTAPLLAFAWLLPRSGLTIRTRLGSLGAAAAGAAAWAIPLVAASGGLAGYAAALGSQAGEDFSGVVMLWTNRTPRVAGLALFNTFVQPWDWPALAGVMVALAAGGVLVLLARVRTGNRSALAPRPARWDVRGLTPLVLLVVIFGPYAVFHLVLQETITIRYALPMVLPVAYLAATALSSARPAAALLVSAGLVAAMLWAVVPASIAYARTPSPIFSTFAAMAAASEPAPLVAMHRRLWTESRRARLWTGQPTGTLLAAPRDYEWLEVTRAWRERDIARTWFVADPSRTDLALIDPASRSVTRYRWPFNAATYVGGARPNEVDLVTVARPGWFLDQGWSLTPEAAGVTQRDGWGPHRRPSIGWITRRSGDAVLMMGGRHLGSPADPPVTITVTLDDQPLLTFEVTPGFFLRFEPIAAERLAGEGRVGKLAVSASQSGGGAVPPVAIEQFDLQPPNVPELGFDTGWHEPEYNPATGRSWRWMSERATMAVRGGAGDVTLRISGEATRRYFPRGSRFTVSAGGQAVATAEIGQDFELEVRIPRDLLTKADGRVSFETDQMFIPGDREGTADRRHLAVRLYSVTASTR